MITRVNIADSTPTTQSIDKGNDMRKKVIGKNGESVWVVLVLSEGPKVDVIGCSNESQAVDTASEIIGVDITDDDCIDIDEHGWITPKGEESDIGVKYETLMDGWNK